MPVRGHKRKTAGNAKGHARGEPLRMRTDDRGKTVILPLR